MPAFAGTCTVGPINRDGDACQRRNARDSGRDGLPETALQMRDILLVRLPISVVCICVGLLLGSCSFNFDSDSVSDGGLAKQPYPVNYRAELLAFLRTYMSDPAGLRGTTLAEPVQKTLGSRQRYVACVQYSAKNSNGGFEASHDRAVVYTDGRFDRLIEQPEDLCKGAAYGPFPELEKLTR